MGGGVKRVLKLAGNDVITAYDNRIVGNADFVEYLKQENEVSNRLELRIPLVKYKVFGYGLLEKNED